MPERRFGGFGGPRVKKSPLSFLTHLPKVPSLATRPGMGTKQQIAQTAMFGTPVYGATRAGMGWQQQAAVASKAGFPSRLMPPALSSLYTAPVQPGGGGGGGGAAPATTAIAPPAIKNLWDIKWQQASYDVPGGNKPSWWVNLVPKDVKDAERPDVQYLMMLNTMIPYLSPEDQRNAASQLYSTAADAFSYYKPERTPITAPIGLETLLTSPAAQAAGTPVLDEAYYGSKQRAEEATTALSNMRQATVKGNRWKLGPGYTWLQSLIGAFTGFGSGEQPGAGSPPPIAANKGQRLTSTQMMQLLGSLDPLLAQGQGGEIGPFGAIGRMFAQPFATSGQVFGPRQKNRLLGF